MCSVLVASHLEVHGVIDSTLPDRAALAAIVSPTILVVEDDQDLRRFFGWMLRHAGYGVELAEDAIGAVSAARRMRPDLILLDLGLPGGGGTVVLERLRNLSATALVEVVVVTGTFPDYDRAKQLEALGCDTVLIKPVTSEQLLSRIAAKIGEGDLPTTSVVRHEADG